MSLSENQKKQYSENCVLFSLAGIITYFFFTNVSMLQIRGISLVFYFFFACLVASIVFRICVNPKLNTKTQLFLAMLCCVCIVGWRETGELEVLMMGMLILGCVGIKSEKIIITFIITTSVELCVTVLGAMTGKIENLIYQRNGSERISFGTIYPTIFATQLLCFYFCIMYIRRKKLTLFEPVIGLAAGVFVFKFCGARTSAVCFVVFAIATELYLILNKINGRRRKKSGRNTFCGILFTCCPVFSAIVIINLSLLYNRNQSLWIKINSILSERLIMGREGFDIYDISLFGQFIPQVGNGGTTKIPSNYFYLDSAYVSYLLRYGLVVFMMFLITMCLLSYFAWKRREIILLLIMVILSFHGIMEDRLLSVATNPFLWLLFSNMTVKGERKCGKNLRQNYQ